MTRQETIFNARGVAVSLCLCAAGLGVSGTASAASLTITGDLGFVSANAPGGPTTNLEIDFPALNDPLVTGSFTVIIDTLSSDPPGATPGTGGNARTQMTFSSGVTVDETSADFQPQPAGLFGTTLETFSGIGFDQMVLGLNLSGWPGGNGFTLDLLTTEGAMFDSPGDISTLKDFGADFLMGSLRIDICDTFADPYFSSGAGSGLSNGFCGARWNSPLKVVRQLG